MSKSKRQSTANLTLRCPDGCIEIEYRAFIDGTPADARQLLNEQGPPIGVADASGKAVCPGCDEKMVVDWGDEPDG